MKNLLILALGLGILVSAVYVANSFVYQQKQDSGEVTTPYQATLTGQYTCLPPKDQTGPTTLECAFGFQTQTGEYYALDLGENADMTQFISGQTTTLSGTITPLPLLSTDHWQKYDIEGIFSVTPPDESIEAQIKEALIAKRGAEVSELDITVSEVVGEYAKGGASKTGLGGGMWFAAKVSGNWEIVWDGNGIIGCGDLAAYPEFPSSLIPSCVDETSGELVERL